MDDANLRIKAEYGDANDGEDNFTDSNTDLSNLLPIPVLVCNDAGSLIYLNAAANNFFGAEIQKGNTEWHNHLRLYTLQGIPLNYNPFTETSSIQNSTRESIIIENTIGEKRRVSVIPQPIVTAGGSRTCLFTLIPLPEDDTLQTQLESANKIAAHTRIPTDYVYRMIEEVQDYAIIMLDKNGTILNWNRGAERIKGYSADEIIGQNFRKFYLPEDNERQLPARLITEAMEKDRALHEGWRVRKNGSIFWGVVVITAIHDNSGEIIGFTKVTRDLTDKKAAEDKIRNYSAELEFKNRELEEFAYIASHDLQEPLRKIQTFAALIKANPEKLEKNQAYNEKILSAAERMSGLVQEVLRYAKMAYGAETATVDLNIELQHAIEDYEVLIKEKNARLHIDFLPLVKGYEVQLRQLFSNLIGNALKFAPTDRRPELQISCAPAPHTDILKMPALRANLHYHKFEFKDNGIGFSEEFCGKIFKMFQRIDTAKEGYGIGLALCQKIVNNHHGYIKAESEIGHGTKITLYLPAMY